MNKHKKCSTTENALLLNDSAAQNGEDIHPERIAVTDIGLDSDNRVKGSSENLHFTVYIL